MRVRVRFMARVKVRLVFPGGGVSAFFLKHGSSFDVTSVTRPRDSGIHCLSHDCCTNKNTAMNKRYQADQTRSVPHCRVLPPGEFSRTRSHSHCPSVLKDSRRHTVCLQTKLQGYELLTKSQKQTTKGGLSPGRGNKSTT